MHSTKTIIGIIAGAIFTAASLAISFYLFQMNTKGSSALGPARNFAFLGVIFGVIYGLPVGGISGALIIGLKFNLVKAILFGLLLNLILGLGLSAILGADWNEKLVYNFLIPMSIGAVNAIIVSLICSSNKSQA